LFTAALAEDLNTSEARAAIFDLVRAGNTAADSGKLFDGNIPAIQEALRRFDEVFAVLEDRDAEIARRSLQWAEEEGRGDQAAPGLVAAYSLSDQQIDALVAEREQARRSRNFARSDSIRNQLAGLGIVLEDSKDGARWKRK
jgi:cysteinyl-tRNA synthetase